MKKLIAILGRTLLATLLCLSQAAVQAEDATFTEAELDQMMAPIALYPDSLLAQILMATTYPADVVEAVEWSKNNPDQKGDAAVNAVQDKPWDPSVMSLVAFPQVLTMMGEQPEWVQNVGDAFLADSDGVMDTVQKLRNKAQEEGNLETTEQQKVIVQQAPSTTETVIIIEPADPQIVYVPTYNPTVVYGAWWWPHYTPWYYYPPGYAYGSPLAAGIAFGIGVGITHALWGNCHWGHGNNNVNINVNKYNNINRNKLDINNKNANWKHNSSNRRGVPYRDDKSRQQYENKRGGADQRKEYRGRDDQRDKARATLDKRAVDPAEGRKQLQGSGGEKTRESLSKANRDIAQGNLASRDTGASRDAAKGMSRDQAKGTAAKRDAGTTRDLSSSRTPSRNNALSGAGNAKKERQSIERGNSSNRSMNSRSGGGGRGGGGGGFRR